MVKREDLVKKKKVDRDCTRSALFLEIMSDELKVSFHFFNPLGTKGRAHKERYFEICFLHLSQLGFPAFFRGTDHVTVIGALSRFSVPSSIPSTFFFVHFTLIPSEKHESVFPQLWQIGFTCLEGVNKSRKETEFKTNYKRDGFRQAILPKTLSALLRYMWRHDVTNYYRMRDVIDNRKFFLFFIFTSNKLNNCLLHYGGGIK